MKILQIRFQNLNSLAGEWHIDFTHSDYTANGIFAITGPTGSGKTTLLDAFCLALYGRTPRLERITESGNEIMSRHTGVCFSEVLFETKKGRYRCHWSQRRARGQASGKLQSVRHEIADDASGTVLESKLKDVARVVEEVTGMNFDQFTRSVLLAQGGFAAFLKASSDERAPILEQITGSEIYSRISQKVHQLRGEEQQRLALLEAEQGAVTLLTDEEVAAISADLACKKADGESIIARLHDARAGLAWRFGLQALEDEIANLTKQEEDSNRQLTEAAPERLVLNRAEKVRLLDGQYGALTVLRTQQKNDEIESEKARQDIAALVLEQQKAGTGHKEAREIFDRADAACRQEVCLTGTVRSLDIRIREALSQTEHFRKELENAEGERLAHAETEQGILASLAEGRGRQEEVRDYLLQHQADADLLEDLAGLQEIVAAVTRQAAKVELLKGEMVKAREAVRKVAVAARHSVEMHNRNRENHDAAGSRQQAMTKAVADLLAGKDPAAYREELEKLTENLFALDKAAQTNRRVASLQEEIAAVKVLQDRAASDLEEAGGKLKVVLDACGRQRLLVEKQEQIVRLAGRIRSLDQERSRLVRGEPCPLCGAVEHPYTVNTLVLPEEAETALIREKDALQSLQNRETGLQSAIATGNERYRLAGMEKKKLQVQVQLQLKELSALLEILSVRPEDIEADISRIDAERALAKAFLEELEGKLQQRDMAGREADTLKDCLSSSLQAMQQAINAESLAVENRRRLDEEGRTLDEEMRKRLETFAQRISRYGVFDSAADTCRDVLAGLSERQGKWRLAKEREQQILTLMQRLQIDREREAALVKKQDSEIKRIVQELRLREEHLRALRQERRERYGDKDPELEEKRLAERRVEAERVLTRIEESLQRLEKDRAVLEERLGSLRQYTTDRAVRLVAGECDFLTSLLASGFADEADYNDARLPDGIIAERTRVLNELTERQIRSGTLLQNQKERREAERKKELTPLSSDDLTARIDEMTAFMHSLQQEIGMLQGKLQEDRLTRAKQQSRLKALEGQRLEYRRWQRLHDLIGSGDGKKFRNFAQGITFEIMVGHANRSLRKMTDRYILTRDLHQPLELNVIDTYQAGEIRSTKNLSGGESFIVSLALALGLAGMASNTVQVDSLFLDEGFGTLDEESLETALETLAGLQQEGKIIGIISHVPVLQERISTRIQVIPGPAGRSRLKGPGVSG